MVKQKPKNYPNVRVSPETFEILGYLKEERGSSYDTVIRDMLSEFAPFLMKMVSHKYDPNVRYLGDRERISRYNIMLGAKQAYADYWLRIRHQLEEEEAEADRVSAEVEEKFKD